MQPSRLLSADGQVRAMVLALGQPADWALLSVVWRAVQEDMGLPAPGIVVSGADDFQLWFSLQEPVGASDAFTFVSALRQRYLGDVIDARLAIWPDASSLAAGGVPAWGLQGMPGQEIRSGQWSAFIAPDLAPVFVDTPWLDIPPNQDGQAELLSRLQCISMAQWRAWQKGQASIPTSSSVADVAASLECRHLPGLQQSDPRRFLLDVMNDASLDMALRIEAAKALLPYAIGPKERQ